MSTYFMRIIRLLHILQRLNGFSCLTFSYVKKFEIKFKWYDKLSLIFFVLLYSFLLVYYWTANIQIQNIISQIYLSSIFIINILAVSASFHVTITSVVFRKYLLNIITEINAIEEEVSFFTIYSFILFFKLIFRIK